MYRNHRPNQAAAAVSAVLLASILVACSDATSPTIEPGAPALARGGTVGASFADVLRGDFALGEADAPALTSSCPGQSGAPGWAAVFGKSRCLIVAPLWASTVYRAYTLEDDIVIGTLIEKGKNGRITHVRLNGQDVDGTEGIWHSTDWIAVAVPVIPSKAGFTLHVHAANVQVWRYDSHLGDGNRVAIIGTVSIGDIVYRSQ